jgi:hypothetical protein
MNSEPKREAPSLNEHQARRVRVTCHYIDRLLSEIEGILQGSSSASAFPRFSADVDPELRGTIEGYVSRIRSQLVRALDERGIHRHEPPVSSSHAIYVALGTIDIALQELQPKHMRGYGELKENAAKELNKFVSETRGLVSELEHCLGPRKDD